LFSWSTPGNLLEASDPNTLAKEPPFTRETKKKQQKVTEVNSSLYPNSTRAIMMFCYLTPRQSAKSCSIYHRLPQEHERQQGRKTQGEATA